MINLFRIVENVRKRIEVLYGPGCSRPLAGGALDEIPSDVRIISMPPPVRGAEGVEDEQTNEVHEPPPPPSQLLSSTIDSSEESFLPSHRFQVTMKSRRQLTESLERYGALESSLFETDNLMIEHSSETKWEEHRC
ncbi:hypothetical protein L218DRAFT_955832 [Marasmius fiardii PR-910]|nr:hypothetical protein L218DRAFT_955832 [Marasmius fiardii PR-910]